MFQFSVKVARDLEWQKSYWTPSDSTLISEVQVAFREFERQFPGVEFVLKENIYPWDVPGVRPQVDFPFHFLWGLEKGIPMQKLLPEISRRLQEAGICSIPQEIMENVAQVLERESPVYQHGYLSGFLANKFLETLLEALERDFLIGDREIIVGFTAKAVLEHHHGCLGLSRLKKRHALVGFTFYSSPKITVLHELGHLFGALHPEDEHTKSIMNSSGGDTTNFDPENIQRIQEVLAELEG